MAGLLDYDKLMANPLLQMGIGLLGSNTGHYGAFGPAMGAGLQQGLQNYQNIMQQQQNAALRKQQQDMQQEQFGWEKAQRERQSAQQAQQADYMNQFLQTLPPEQQAAARAFPQLGQSLVQQQFKPQEPIKLGKGERLLDPTTRQELVPAMQTPDEMPSAVQEYNFAKQQGYPGSFLDFQLAQRRAGASSTNVNYGAPVAGVDAFGNPVFFQPSKEGGTPAIVPGVRPKPSPEESLLQTPENAGKIAMQQQALTDIAGARELVFGKNGQLNRAVLLETQLPGGGFSENSRMLSSKIENAIAAKLRIETGAAAPVEEVRNIAKRFMPTQFDSKKSAKDKLDRLETYFNISLGQTRGVAKQPEQTAKPRTRADILKQYGVR